MVTPEMLRWLAGKMGLSVANTGGVMTPSGLLDYIFEPHNDDAQFGRLVVWAWLNGIVVDNRDGSVLAELDGGPTFIVDHNSTPDSIRAAAVVAVCRALGFDAAMESANG